MKANVFKYGLICAVILFLGSASLMAEDKKAFIAKGMYVEGCSCDIPCRCELTGPNIKCQGVGAMNLKEGKFNGTDLKDVKMAYAMSLGKWIDVFVDAPTPEKSKAAGDFAKTYFHDWAKDINVKDGKIQINGGKGKYAVKVNDGKTMEFQTEPVLGGDGKNPIQISNTKSQLNPTFSQAHTIAGRYQEGDHSLELSDSNSYFNEKMNAKGELAVK